MIRGTDAQHRPVRKNNVFRGSGTRHLRLLELGREFDDSLEELFVFAEERRFLRLAGHVEYAKHDDQENRDGGQNGYGHVGRESVGGPEWTFKRRCYDEIGGGGKNDIRDAI